MSSCSDAPAAAEDRLPTITVVIPALDAAAWIGGQLAALAEQRYDADWEVVVADNGSSDGTLAVVEAWRPRLPRLRVVDASRARGINVARNEGALSSTMDAVAFCDADDEVAPGWLRAAGEALRAADGVCGPLDETALNTEEVRSWRSPILTDRMPTGWSWLRFLHGGNCAIRRSVFVELGGYDESYRRGGDDVELSWRLQLADHTVAFAPGMVVRYRHRSTPSTLMRQQYHFGRQDVQLYRDFAQHGMPRSSLRDVARGWAKILWFLPSALHDSNRRARVLSLLARRVGRISGSLSHRRLYL